MSRERVDRDSLLAVTRLSVAELRQLITLMNTSDIGELTIEEEASGLKLTLRKPAVPMGYFSEDADGSYDEDEGSDDEEQAAQDQKLITVRAPFVGYFRASLKQGGAPLVAQGDVIKAEKPLGAIESLNVLNEIMAPADGRLKQLLVSDGEPVEYGKPLMVIEPKAPAR